jgi:UDP-galactopyranose mutase
VTGSTRYFTQLYEGVPQVGDTVSWSVKRATIIKVVSGPVEKQLIDGRTIKEWDIEIDVDITPYKTWERLCVRHESIQG